MSIEMKINPETLETPETEMTGAQNRQRWAVDQKRQARASFVAPDQSQRLNELRALATMLARPEFRQMADQISAVRAEISRLEAAI